MSSTAPARVAAAGIVFALATGVAACAGGRTSLGTTAGVCFRDLPPARQAVKDKGHLVGVRRVSADTLRARLPNDRVLATVPDQELCVFAFQGIYPPGSVHGAHNTKAGHYALVALGTRHPVLVESFVTDQLPTRFRHLH